MFIVVFDDPRAESAKTLLLGTGYDVFAVNEHVLLVRTDNVALALTEEIAVAAKIKGPEQIEESRGVVFELGLGRSGFHKSALWEWIRR